MAEKLPTYRAAVSRIQGVCARNWQAYDHTARNVLEVAVAREDAP